MTLDDISLAGGEMSREQPMIDVIDAQIIEALAGRPRKVEPRNLPQGFAPDIPLLCRHKRCAEYTHYRQ
jgi:hypothetical protein